MSALLGMRPRVLMAIGASLSLVVASCTKRDESSASAAVSVSARELGLGRPATPQEIAALDLDVNPAGVGLPAGQATAVSGAAIYAAKCARCHGAKGEGIAPSPALVGRIPGDSFPFGNDPKVVKTVGNYWPYATTLYDYVNRAMPLNAPGSLTPGEVYSLVGFLLWRNDIVADSAVMTSQTLPRVIMPARNRFVLDNRRGGPEIR